MRLVLLKNYGTSKSNSEINQVFSFGLIKKLIFNFKFFQRFVFDVVELTDYTTNKERNKL